MTLRVRSISFFEVQAAPSARRRTLGTSRDRVWRSSQVLKSSSVNSNHPPRKRLNVRMTSDLSSWYGHCDSPPLRLACRAAAMVKRLSTEKLGNDSAQNDRVAERPHVPCMLFLPLSASRTSTSAQTSQRKHLNSQLPNEGTRAHKGHQAPTPSTPTHRDQERRRPCHFGLTVPLPRPEVRHPKAARTVREAGRMRAALHVLYREAPLRVGPSAGGQRRL